MTMLLAHHNKPTQSNSEEAKTSGPGAQRQHYNNRVFYLSLPGLARRLHERRACGLELLFPHSCQAHGTLRWGAASKLRTVEAKPPTNTVHHLVEASYVQVQHRTARISRALRVLHDFHRRVPNRYAGVRIGTPELWLGLFYASLN